MSTVTGPTPGENDKVGGDADHLSKVSASDIERNASLVLLWSIAEAMTRQNGESRERIWLTLMRAFWRGEFARGGLMLRQSRPTGPGSEMFAGLTRDDLAKAALGSDAVARIGLDRAYDELQGWRVDDYQNIREERFRYYFERDPQGTHGLGVGQTEAADWIAHGATTQSGKAWLTLSEAVNYLAFGEAIGKEDLASKGYPSERTMLPEIQAAWRQCRDESQGDTRFRHFVELLKDEGGNWREPGKCTGWLCASELRDFTGPRPPSAQALADVLTKYETARCKEDEALNEARSAIRAAMLAGDLTLAGVRYGRLVFEDIDPRLIDGTIEIKETLNTIQGRAERWTAAGSDGGRIEWNNVTVEREAFAAALPKPKEPRPAKAPKPAPVAEPIDRTFSKDKVSKAYKAALNKRAPGARPWTQNEDWLEMKKQIPGLPRAAFRDIRNTVLTALGRGHLLRPGPRTKPQG